MAQGDMWAIQTEMPDGTKGLAAVTGDEQGLNRFVPMFFTKSEALQFLHKNFMAMQHKNTVVKISVIFDAALGPEGAKNSRPAGPGRIT